MQHRFHSASELLLPSSVVVASFCSVQCPLLGFSIRCRANLSDLGRVLQDSRSLL